MRDLAASSPVTGEGFLAAQFLAFHAELVAVKRALCAQPDDTVQRLPAAVAHGLCGFLETQDGHAEGWGGRFAYQNTQEARYLKAALADEALIGLHAWEHSAAWTGELLELRLFGSRCAGDRVFDAIHALLRERHPARRELGMLYLYALAMGFEGRYRGAPDSARIVAALREELYAYATGDSVERLQLSGARGGERELARHLLPQSYQFTASGNASCLPDPRRWIWFCAAACVILFGCAGMIWQVRTSELAGHFRTSADAHPGRPAAAAAKVRS
jgi:type VI secretion system protein ImpK